MTARSAAAGFLPSIKCSNCNVEIEISMMGDHVCRQASTQSRSRFDKFNNTLAYMNAPAKTEQPPAKSGRMPPPRIDASGAGFPLESNQPKSSSSNSMRSTTPTSAVSSRSKLPFPPPPRSATAPIYSPPSPDLQLPQDCAFPMFPTAKSRSTTPTIPLAAGRSFENGRGRVQTDSSGIIAPKSLRPHAGAFLSKMNTIAPGPFNVSGKGADGSLPRPPSADSTRSTRSNPSQARTGVRINPLHVPWGPGNGDVTASPTAPTFSGSLSSAQFLASDTPPPPSPTANVTPAPLGPSVRSQTFPSDGQNRMGPAVSASTARRPSEPSTSNSSAANSASSTYSVTTSASSSTSSHPHRPSNPAANRPLHEIGSTSSYKASRKGPSRSTSPTRNDTGASAPRSGSRAGERTDPRLNGAPPVPAPTRAEEFGVGNPYHAPTTSTSSNESSNSGVISGSSSSSPPLLERPYRTRRKPSDTAQSENVSSTPQIPNIKVRSPPKSSHAGRGPSKSFSRPTYARPVVPPSAETPESPMDPAFQPSQFSPSSPPDKPHSVPRPERGVGSDNVRNQNASLPLRSHPPQAAPPPKIVPKMDPVGPSALQGPHYDVPATTFSSGQTPTAPVLQRPDVPAAARRPSTANKGQCRGCGDLIQGKSVSSADGRLTGRYHKQCFVCRTCKEPFQTADFYVLNNNPYCARHYHTLNDSLCKTCDRGIEGQYLETEVKQKFHPHCFTCQSCRKMLRDDYFELNGKIFCEQHAFRAANEPSLLGPGRRHPERRTTRLMMM